MALFVGCVLYCLVFFLFVWMFWLVVSCFQKRKYMVYSFLLLVFPAWVTYSSHCLRIGSGKLALPLPLCPSVVSDVQLFHRQKLLRRLTQGTNFNSAS